MTTDFFKFNHFAFRSHEEMKEVLMNPQAEGPKNHYYLMRGGKEIKNITVWEFGTVGGEYIKTYGHYHVGKLSETYRIICGEGIVLLQKRRLDQKGIPIDDRIEEFKALFVKEGDNIYMPEGVGHLAVNITKTWLATIDDSPVNFSDVDPITLPGHADYSPIRKMHGFAYYVVEKNGKPEFIKNSCYLEVPEIKIEKT